MTITIFFNGTIVSGYTAEGITSTAMSADATALAVRDGRIVAIGADALALIDQFDPQMIDLDSGWLAPTFGDGHAHPMQGGLETLGPQVHGCTSVEEIVECVRQWAESHPDDEWIYGGSYDATVAPDGLFDARWLDAACRDRPVVLRASDYHTVWVNSEAMRRAGIVSETPEPPLGRIPRRDDGTPLGTLQEPGAVDLLIPVEPGRSREDRVEAIRIATAHYARLGIGWIQDAWVEPVDVDAYLEASRVSALSVRVNLALRADPLTWRDQVESFLDARRAIEANDDPLLTAHTVKVFVDGVVENHTALLLDDYTDVSGERGMANWSADELTEAAILFDTHGFQLHFHAIGDGAGRAALDVFEAVEQTNGLRDRRPVIAHVQLLQPEDRPRFHAIGAIANFEPLWAQLGAMMVELTLPRIGSERERQQYPIRSLADDGTAISFGSDWPVSSADWRPGVATAITRQTGAGYPADGWTPAERLAQSAALAAYSSGVAWQALAENRWGSLTVGSDADLLWLDRDPRSTPPHELHTITVRGTWVAGIERTSAHHTR